MNLNLEIVIYYILIKMSNIVRNIKLSKIGCYQIKDDEKNLYQYIEKNLLNLKIVVLKKYIGWVFYFNSNDKCIFMFYIIDNIIYINIFLLNIFIHIFNYKKEDEIKIIIYNILSNDYKIKNIQINNFYFRLPIKDVEHDYKNEINLCPL